MNTRQGTIKSLLAIVKDMFKCYYKKILAKFSFREN